MSVNVRLTKQYLLIVTSVEGPLSCLILTLFLGIKIGCFNPRSFTLRTRQVNKLKRCVRKVLTNGTLSMRSPNHQVDFSLIFAWKCFYNRKQGE